jgi:hypothetical protein
MFGDGYIYKRESKGRVNKGSRFEAVSKALAIKNKTLMNIEGDTAMRTIIVAGLTAAAIGLAATTGASAAPANGAVIGDLATATGHVTTVQHWRWGSGGHWRWGSGGHWRWRSHGHWRWRSRGY